VHATLDDLVIALYVTIDELLAPCRGPGRPPKLADSELICLAVAQVLVGYRSERRWLRAVHTRLGHLFPSVLGQAAYNRRLRRAARQQAQRPGMVVLANKGLVGQAFEQVVADLGARLVLEDFGHYATGRKPREGEDALLVLDEFSALASGVDSGRQPGRAGPGRRRSGRGRRPIG
jgi:hypothetical protein